MSRLIAALFLLAPALASASSDVPYNKGVDAFKAKKYDEAFRHWSEAASHGNVSALNNLGFLLYRGHGVPKDQEAAIDLWRTAAYAGHPESQWHLAEAYEFGAGVKKDRSRAYGWYQCAVASATWKLEHERRRWTSQKGHC
jgi:TPR repeat protein